VREQRARLRQARPAERGPVVDDVLAQRGAALGQVGVAEQELVDCFVP
jgi:hypothetical protein